MEHQHGKTASSSPQLKDPVCGMTVSELSPHMHEHGGRKFYFCSAKCKAKFEASPAQYLAPPESAEVVSPVPAGTVYTCPMHPEIRQDHPGNCPKCGMTLEPVLPSLDDEENPEPVHSGSPVIIDDIVSSGHTLAKVLLGLGALGTPAVTCVIVHALFSDGAEAALLSAGANRIVSTNTVAHATNGIDIVPLVAEAVRTQLQ